MPIIGTKIKKNKDNKKNKKDNLKRLFWLILDKKKITIIPKKKILNV